MANNTSKRVQSAGGLNTVKGGWLGVRIGNHLVLNLHSYE